MRHNHHRATSRAVTPAAAEEYLRAVDLLGQTSGSGHALDKANYLISADGHGLTDVPEPSLLHISALQAQRTGSNTPTEAPIDDLRRAYDSAAHMGKFTTAVMATFSRDLPVINPVMVWPLFSAHWPMIVYSVDAYGKATDINTGDTRAAISGAWALSLVAQGHYDEAADTLHAATVATSPLYQVARLALYTTTGRWSDLAHVSSDVATSPAAANDPLLYTISQACSGLAHASLGNRDVADEAFSHVEHSQFAVVIAWSLYNKALYYRTLGDTDTAATLLARSLSLNFTAQAKTAQDDPTICLRVTTEEIIASRTSFWDPTTEDDPEQVKKLERESKRESYAEQAESLLSQQIGMDEIKREMKRIAGAIRLNAERARRGTEVKAANYNLVLTGPPGTGKSTITRYLGLILAAEGIIDDPEPVVTGASDFVADVIGGTRIKTKETLARFHGKLGFIDEFYDLVNGGTGDNSNVDSFGKEAINTLVAESEPLIGKAVIVIAGYEADVDRAIAINDGMASRFPRRVKFGSFTVAQFAAVVEILARSRKLTLSAAACEYVHNPAGDMRRLHAFIPEEKTSVIDKLGNGRFARNLVERAEEYMGVRLADTDLSALSDAELSELSVDDVRGAFISYTDSVL